jgi:hypothetical protein
MSEPTAPTPVESTSKTLVDQSEAPAPRRRGLIGLLRGAVARYLRFVVRHRFLGCLASLILLLFLCGGASLVGGRFLPGGRTFSMVEEVEVNPIGTVMNDAEEPVDAYILAMVNFDAQGMWDAYSPPAREQLTARGGSPQQLQQGLDQAHSAGARYTGSTRIGNYPLRDGRRYVFYILSRTGFPPNGGDEEIYFIFTVDPSGRILNVT